MATKCPGCGLENPDGTRLCKGCGRFLAPKASGTEKKTSAPRPIASSGGLGRTSDSESCDPKSVHARMKSDYARGVGDQTQRCLDGIQSLLTRLRQPRIDMDGLLNEAANLIWRQLGIDNVAIGLRDPDGLYRYKAMVGFREDALSGHRQIAYRREQFFDNGHFIGSDISKCSRIYLAEVNTLTAEEEKTFNRPGLLTLRRKSSDDSLEGDYIDTKILGQNDELLGWVEISGTRLMKLPDSASIRWVEAIASIIGIALLRPGRV